MPGGAYECGQCGPNPATSRASPAGSSQLASCFRSLPNPRLLACLVEEREDYVPSSIPSAENWGRTSAAPSDPPERGALRGWPDVNRRWARAPPRFVAVEGARLVAPRRGDLPAAPDRGVPADPRTGRRKKDLHLLNQLNVGWLAAGIVFEATSLLCYALLTRSLLLGARPGLSRLVRIVLATTGVAHVIPGGGGAAAGYQLCLRPDSRGRGVTLR